MLYAIESIVDNTVLLENIESKEKLYIDIKKLPNNIKEGYILEYINKKYVINNKIYNDRRKKIQEKLEHLKNN